MNYLFLFSIEFFILLQVLCKSSLYIKENKVKSNPNLIPIIYTKNTELTKKLLVVFVVFVSIFVFPH